jgi:flavin reductase (DIM6/NTAB) family NADH-FMN oxidoreductase RutF
MSDDAIKNILNRIPYGFYSITSRSGDNVNAMVANWVTQASFEPRLLALGLQKSSYTHGLITQGGVFGVNLFLKEDAEKIKAFSKSRAKNPEKMEGVHYTAGPETGVPILEGTAGHIECRVQEIIDIGGDHDIVIGEVVGAGVTLDGDVKDTLTLPTVGWSYAG